MFTHVIHLIFLYMNSTPQTIVHTACSRHQTEVVKLLVDSDISKKTLYTKADNGSLPIHAGECKIAINQYCNV